MQRTAMRRDFSWHTAARSYLALYDELVPDIGFGTVIAERDAA
jgi:glycogen synthase